MLLMFSEPMSINFEAPTRNSTMGKQANLSKSFANDNKVILEADEEDEESKVQIVKDEEYGIDLLTPELQVRTSKSFEQQLDTSQLPKSNTSRLPRTREVQDRLRQKPFIRAITLLKEINSKEGPMMKLRLLERVNSAIKDHIENFWQGIPIDPSHLTITQDTKIPLYIYLVIKSKLVNLAAHIKFIQEFTTSYVHESGLGGNLALYESAMMIVADKQRNTIYNVLDQNEVYRTVNAQYFQSFATSNHPDDLDPFVSFLSSVDSRAVLE